MSLFVRPMFSLRIEWVETPDGIFHRSVWISSAYGSEDWIGGWWGTEHLAIEDAMSALPQRAAAWRMVARPGPNDRKVWVRPWAARHQLVLNEVPSQENGGGWIDLRTAYPIKVAFENAEAELRETA